MLQHRVGGERILSDAGGDGVALLQFGRDAVLEAEDPQSTQEVMHRGDRALEL